MGWFRRLSSTIRGSRVEGDFEEEVRFHLEQRAADYAEDGLTPVEARAAAARRFGNLLQARERTRDADTFRWLADIGTDVRYTWRLCWKTPGFTLLAMLTLALGLGANTALFAAAYGVLIRPLPYQDADRLVRLSEYHAGAQPLVREAIIARDVFDA